MPVLSHPEEYEVSSHGNVRALARTVFIKPSSQHPNGCYRSLKAHPVKISIWSGRRCVALCRLAKYRHAKVAVLMLEAFAGPRPRNRYACHKDDNPLNEHLSNLYWGTPLQNSADKITNGHQRFGQQCWNAKLTYDEVLEIRNRTGEIHQALADQFGVTQSCITNIINLKKRVAA